MNEWLKWALGFLCVSFIALKIFCTIWIAIQLRRKWRSCPEFWSIDWLDIVLRIEQEFCVEILAADFETIPSEARVEITAGQLWEVVSRKMTAKGFVVSQDGWERLKMVISEALNVRPAKIALYSRLYSDLGMIYGIVYDG
jgi:hypothetical protein